tara:strand:- start:30 stop:251 length:222 start_codon:yes stop_codon:yes gene_type:complete
MSKYKNSTQSTIIKKILKEIQKEINIRRVMLERISQLNFPEELIKAYEDCITYSKGKIKGMQQAIKILEAEDL